MRRKITNLIMNSSQERSKEGKRPFPEDKTILGSPCDCKVSVYPIEEKTSFCCKGYKIYVGFIDQKPQDRKTFFRAVMP